MTRTEILAKINETYTTSVGRKKAVELLEGINAIPTVPEFKRGHTYKNKNGKVFIVYYAKGGKVRMFGSRTGARTKLRTAEENFAFLESLGYVKIADNAAALASSGR